MFWDLFDIAQVSGVAQTEEERDTMREWDRRERNRQGEEEREKQSDIYREGDGPVGFEWERQYMVWKRLKVYFSNSNSLSSPFWYLIHWKTCVIKKMH